MFWESRAHRVDCNAPCRVCGDGFDCVRTAGISRLARPERTFDATSARSTP
ncbi:hypothetical protein BZL30_5415 [Mycobacterium kansasii]|uniref:Uncharacterized protein n=1 Tax=Mycobacterium kansasii TaxID=1768 RepID=A0A1V3WYP2_MYCKA|nr:hypothetical protein BZL30_5415 [Mycobacterium kansasii]